MTSEAAFLAQVFLRHGHRPDLRIFRNATALAYVGKLVIRAATTMQYTLRPGDAVIRGCRPIQAGLAIGSADIIGVQLDASEWIGRFVSIETKTEGGREAAQQAAWGDMVRTMGGLHVLARTMDEVDAALGPPR